MKDLIKEILDANEKIEHDSDSVEKLKMESSSKVDAILNERREEYIDKARMNIKVIKKIEDSKAAIEIDRIHSDCNEMLSKLDIMYSERKDEWSNQIFNYIISLDKLEYGKLGMNFDD